MINISLDSSFGKHGKLWYKNLHGIATGGSLSVSLANIAVFYVLRYVIYNSDDIPDSLISLKRFVDDLTGLWKGTKRQFVKWADSVNKQLALFGLSIKDNEEDEWEFNPPGEFTTFLDIKYTFHMSEGLKTDVNIKSTDARVYLHYSSFHPRHIFPSIVYSQCLRYHRLINCGILLLRRLVELKTCFVNSGYPAKMVDNIIDDVHKRPRHLSPSTRDKLPPNKVLWVQTYGPATEDYQNIIKEANNMLKKSPAWEDDPNVIGIMNKRARTVGDLILHRKRLALDTSSVDLPGTVRCTPCHLPGNIRKKGRPCGSCNLMSSKCTIVSTATEQEFKTPCADCKSRNIIYCAECRLCKKQYTGKSVNRLQSRISGHRSHMNDESFDAETDDASLAEHLIVDHFFDTPDSSVSAPSSLIQEDKRVNFNPNSSDPVPSSSIQEDKRVYFNSNFAFTVLELSPADLDRAEQRWTSKLLTMQPFGLNKVRPCGVMDSVTTMCRRSLGPVAQR